ncbi:flagellar biosynthesis anti-sigma factor FlgM [Paenibacillus thermoaerophilus]|uniref:Negative regulator of flagellin synthesis n=1 Tax=Paenibacillus thermoaerophilus TaxID=1215385 RepID=A0ABW2VA71_9BACL|nr:flagellar biosynthesis anti-sigma factor FlgM [Paenibacillus thermoaerophilus]TMV12520.1 flagellar biosynthesis anti-sigma factor FlgM [Paenibacillus thermoaerophilus]
MKINRVSHLNLVQSYQRQHDKINAGPAARSKQKDQVSISPEAQEMLDAQKLDAAASKDRVKQLKEAYTTGTYRVEAGKIAEKLLPFLQ